MKKIILSLAAVVVALATTVAVANRSVELNTLENIQALERAESLDGTKAAITWINENALEHLPVAATLRAENAIAGAALRMAGESVVVATR